MILFKAGARANLGCFAYQSSYDTLFMFVLLFLFESGAIDPIIFTFYSYLVFVFWAPDRLSTNKARDEICASSHWHVAYISCGDPTGDNNNKCAFICNVHSGSGLNAYFLCIVSRSTFRISVHTCIHMLYLYVYNRVLRYV